MVFSNLSIILFSTLALCSCISSASPVTPSPASSSTSASTGSCVDSPLKFQVFFKGKKRYKNCKWVSKNTNRCKKAGVSAICPLTCGSCSNCADTTARFKVIIGGKKRTKDCSWANNWRCSKFEGLNESCRLTCGTCKPSFETFGELEAAVNLYCANPEEWNESSSYTKYG